MGSEFFFNDSAEIWAFDFIKLRIRDAKPDSDSNTNIYLINYMRIIFTIVTLIVRTLKEEKVKELFIFKIKIPFI